MTLNLICCISNKKLEYIQVVVNWDALNIFCGAAFLAFDEYRNISQKDIEDSIKGELSGHFEDLLLAIGKPFSAYNLSYFALVLNRREGSLLPCKKVDRSILMLP